MGHPAESFGGMAGAGTRRIALLRRRFISADF
jgi:hypothetical protein